MSADIQAVLFKKDSEEWKNSKDRLKILKRLNVKPQKRVHITKEFYRYRITEPIYKKYRTFKLSPSINIIYGIE